MADAVHPVTGTLLPAADLAQSLVLQTAPNGIRYASFGDTGIADADLDRVVHAVPHALAAALTARVFYFVPLTLPATHGSRKDAHRATPDQTLVAPVYTAELAEDAICHRNVSVPSTPTLPAHEAVFLSARLLRDQFALAFELFINVGHAFVTDTSIPEAFRTLAWSQAVADTRGETSQDAWEGRTAALATPPDAKAKTDFLESAFADAIAIYLLSLVVDFDYSELREREYPLLAPAALADRLRLTAKLFPPNPGYEFSIRYRRRT